MARGGRDVPSCCDRAVTPYPGHIPMTVPSSSLLFARLGTHRDGAGAAPHPQAPVPALQWGPAARTLWECWDSPRTSGAVKENSIQGSHAQPLPFLLGPNAVPCSQPPGTAPPGGRGAIRTPWEQEGAVCPLLSSCWNSGN